MRPLCALLLIVAATNLSAAELRDVRVWASPDSTRVVFDLTESASHTLFSLEKPDRIVIDLNGVKRTPAIANLMEGKGIVKRIRSAPRDGRNVRIVLDMAEP